MKTTTFLVGLCFAMCASSRGSPVYNAKSDADTYLSSLKFSVDISTLIESWGQNFDCPNTSCEIEVNQLWNSYTDAINHIASRNKKKLELDRLLKLATDLASKYDLPLHGGHSNNPIFDPNYECEIAEFALKREIKKKGSQLAELINVRNQACQGGFIVRGKDVAKKSGDGEMGDQDQQRKDSTTMKDALKIAQDTMKLVRGTFE